MIVVVSDLHLQHTDFDRLRWRDGNKVKSLQVVRNVSAGALQLLLNEIAMNAARCKAQTIELVFNGDIFEMLRSPRWLLGGNLLRPVNYPPTKGLEEKAHTILDDIERENGEFFKVLQLAVHQKRFSYRNMASSLESEILVHYLPGNHDRVLNLFESTRSRVRKLLCIEAAGSAPFPHELVRRESDGRGVLIRHGHEYEPENFYGEFDGVTPADKVYDRPVFGDYCTVDIAMRLPMAFRAFYARELRASDGDCHRAVYAALTEFDDVRPASVLMRYLSFATDLSEQDIASMLRPVLRDVWEAAAADSFFLSEAKRIDRRYLGQPVAAVIDTALKELGPGALSKVIGVLANLGGGSGADPAECAVKEKALKSDADMIIAGHTHTPDLVPLPARQKHERVFLDTGTWRTRITAGKCGSFGRLRSYTMVFCYNEAEVLESGGDKKEARRFETWTGHLVSDQYGIKQDERDAGEQGVSKVKVRSCRIVQIDEGQTHGGAELYLRIGVDSAELQVKEEGVKDGAVIKIDKELPVDSEMDGELWCSGAELDLGKFFLNRDDPLPWGMDRLRDAEGKLIPGLRTLTVADKRGNEYEIEYEVI